MLDIRAPGRRLVSAICGALLLSAGGSPAEDLRLAGMRLGSSWYVFSATLYQLMRDRLPPGYRLEVMSKGGGVANPLLVESGRAHVALSNRATAVWASRGDTRAYADRACPRLRALVGGLNPVPVSVIARRAYLDRSGHADLTAVLAGSDPVRIVMKPRGSSVPVVADMILAAMGSSREAIRARGGGIIQVSAKQIPDVLRNGQADLYFESTPTGHPTTSEVSLATRVRFLSLPDTARRSLARAGLEPITVPETWKGQEGDTLSVDQGTILIARDDLDEELAYRFTRTLCENREALARAHKAWSRFEPREAWRPERTGIALHPGAERYYREQGWMPADP